MKQQMGPRPQDPRAGRDHLGSDFTLKMLRPGPHPRSIQPESGKHPEVSVLICNSNLQPRLRITTCREGRDCPASRHRVAAPTWNTGLFAPCTPVLFLPPQPTSPLQELTEPQSSCLSSSWKGSSPGPSGTSKGQHGAMPSPLRQAGEPLSQLLRDNLKAE